MKKFATNMFKKYEHAFHVHQKYRREFKVFLISTNIQKLLPVFTAVFIIHIPLVILDLYRRQMGIWDKIPAFKYMFYLHLILLAILSTGIGIGYYYRFRKSRPAVLDPIESYFGNIFVFMIMIFFICMTMVDQLINNQISDFIIAVLGYATVFFTSPLVSFLSIFSGVAIFDYLIFKFQNDNGILISHLINANSISIIAFMVSAIFYRQFLKGFSDKKTIEDKTLQLKETLQIIYHDLEQTREIHTKIMPTKPIAHQGIKQSLAYIPANHVGGDFYDYFLLSDNITMRVLLGDVAGHGVSAALNSMAIKSEFDKIKNLNIPVSEILFLLNNMYLERYPGIVLPFTMLLADINPTKKEIQYCSAGHPGPIHQMGTGKTIQLPATGGILGIDGFKRVVNLRTSHFNITSGDTVYMITDGMFEQFSETGEMYGEQRLLEKINGNSTMNLHLDGKVHYIINDIKTHLGSQKLNDDISILAFELL